jgi:hypothetical protein
MEQIAVILILAVITEALVNLFFGDVPQSKVKKYIALAVGILLTVVWKVGILSSLSVTMPNIVATYIDYVMTGVFCSRGSNFVNQLFETLKVYRASKATVETTVTTPQPPAAPAVPETTTTNSLPVP